MAEKTVAKRGRAHAKDLSVSQPGIEGLLYQDADIHAGNASEGQVGPA